MRGDNVENLITLTNFCRKNKILFSENEYMKNHTTFKIGGKADIIIQPSGIEELSDIIKLIKDYDINTYVIGNGSNVLISDNGLRGCVLLIGNKMADIKLIDNNTIYAQAGAPLSQICNFALEHSLTGLEFAYGIPGTVGGAIRMNAGAYGGEIKDVLISAKHITKNAVVEELKIQDLDMSYRHSIYCDNDNIIISGIFKLKSGEKNAIKSKMNELLNMRKSKQPLEFPNAGSTFKRPIGAFAGELIDKCNLKGYKIGDAMVSEKHSGFLINAGNASFDDMVKLIEYVKNIVYKETGFCLKTEVEILK